MLVFPLSIFIWIYFPLGLKFFNFQTFLLLNFLLSHLLTHCISHFPFLFLKFILVFDFMYPSFKICISNSLVLNFTLVCSIVLQFYLCFCICFLDVRFSIQLNCSDAVFSALLKHNWQKCIYKVQCNDLIYLYSMKWLRQST